MSFLPEATGDGRRDTPAAGVTALVAALGEAMTVFAAELADAI